MKKLTGKIWPKIWLLLILIWSPATPNGFFLNPGNIQQSILNRRFRLGVIAGVHLVDSPCCVVSDWAAGAAVHLLLFRSATMESYLVGEGVFSKSRNPVNVQINNETVSMRAPDTRLWGLNLVVTGLNWIPHNPWRILPYTVVGVGLMDRPARSMTVEIPDSYGRPVPHIVTLADCGADAFCVNVGFGLQLYYILRLDFRISLPERSGMTLYRTGVEFIF